MSYKSPLEMFYHWESTKPNEMYLRQPIDGQWKEWTYKEAGQEIRKMAAYLKSLNLPEKSNIALISKNCAHWIMCDLAIMMSGHTSVPMYPNLNSETVKLILEHSESKVLFVGKLDDWASMKPGVPDNGIQCITFPFYSEEGYPVWDDLIKDVEPIAENVVRDQQDLCTIVYTSGTTGMPKGVMHTFFNWSFVSTLAIDHIKLADSPQKFFSYLPLCHIAERFLVEMGSLYTGGSISFAESIDTFPANLADTNPTVFLGVPRIWSKFQQGVLAKMPQKKLDLFLKIPILNNIVRKKIQTALGLIEAKNIFTGAAPTPASLINWYKKLGINIQEAYAMTENCCYSHVTMREWIKIGKVGQALPQVDVKLAPDTNEILIKHEGLMTGYYKEPGMTAETLVDGYLRTGDEGSIDSDGFLQITGRVKDLFKTTKAKYVAPSPIEMKISDNQDVGQVCVVGEGIPQPIALMVLSETGKEKSQSEIEESIMSTIQHVNTTIDPHEQVKKVIIMKEEWTMENGLLTPSLKIKRNPLEKQYKPNYEKWYEAPDSVIWN